MKSFLLASLAAASAAAVEFTREYVEGVGQNGTSGQFVRASVIDATHQVTMLTKQGDTASPISWTVSSQGVYYEDSGEQKIRITHNLTADIFATDTVLFEISYRPKSEPDPTDKASIGEDYFQCEMSQSSSDAAFWTPKIAEGYYVCKPTTAPDDTNVCKYIARDDNDYTQTTESTTDWVAPVLDDDPDNFWCTKKNTKAGDVLDPYECSALKCIMERAIDTFDNVRDLNFDMTATDPKDYMVVQPGRAKLYINKTTAQFAFAASNSWMETAIEIPIILGAYNLVASTLSAITVAALLSF